MADARGNGQLEQEVYRLLTKLFLMVDDYDRRFFAEHRLNARQFWALQHLTEERGCSMGELSRMLLTDKSNVTAIVDRFEEDGWATRTADPSDRRVNLIVLTPEGRRVRDQVNVKHEARIRDLLGAEADERLRMMLELLQPLSGRLETYLAREDGAARVAANGHDGADTGDAL
jgi:DNA-binding MarR family transcriptional regulator